MPGKWFEKSRGTKITVNGMDTHTHTSSNIFVIHGTAHVAHPSFSRSDMCLLIRLYMCTPLIVEKLENLRKFLKHTYNDLYFVYVYVKVFFLIKMLSAKGHFLNKNFRFLMKRLNL